MAEKIQSDLDTTLSDFIKELGAFDQETINKTPDKGGWTAAQVGQHIILSNSGFTEVMNGPVKDTDRSPTAMVQQIKHDFLDFSAKMCSPDAIIPEKKNYNKKELVHSLEDIRKNVLKAVGELDLSKTCTAFELPVYGMLTRLEAANFILYHTQRHIHQLKGIQEAVMS